jgi:CubicO group peptidase (beta-lactamase class C family)
MKTVFFAIAFSFLTMIAAAFAVVTETETRPDPIPATDFVGVWGAHRRFGPEVRGTLSVSRHGDSWSARIAGHVADCDVKGREISFRIAGDRGSFRGRFADDRSRITGHWIQPRSVMMGNPFASPVRLSRDQPGRWRGDVLPLGDEMTFYLVIQAGENGAVSAFLRNPERNIGVFYGFERVIRKGDELHFLGRTRGSNDERELMDATYLRDGERLVIDFGGQYGTYDLVRVEDDPASNFYPRAKGAHPYRYEVPAAEDDGWATASLDNVRMAEEPIRQLMLRVLDTPIDSVNTPYVHAILAARHGKLVLEEYFHGYHGGKPHDTRSASKSVTATMVGAAIQNGDLAGVSAPVYEVIHGNAVPADLEPRKRAMQVEHLLTMTSGFDCDDNDSGSPGNEDVMQSQMEEPDWYHYTLNLPMKREPGEKAVYCSAGSNLLGNVLNQATGTWLPDYFAANLARPLQIDRYYINLMPTGEAYGGGGIYWLPRDFLKLGQLMLDSGMWNGRRLVSEEWVRAATDSLEVLNEQGYGYSWWIISYPYEERTVKAFYAGGNGGQMVIVVPELDLTVLTFAGNYSHFPSLLKLRDEYVGYVIRSIEQAGS